MWYVIQTTTGQEEELMLFMRSILEKKVCKKCFIITAEWLKRLGGEWQIQVRPLFPGYVFVETGVPEELFLRLKSVPKFSRLLGGGRCEFVPLKTEEEKFLRLLIGGNTEYRVNLTTVATSEDGHVIAIDGVLKYFEKNIIRWNLHKRYAVVGVRMLGVEKTVLFGIRLLQDVV